jgi:hypothetical protein
MRSQVEKIQHNISPEKQLQVSMEIYLKIKRDEITFEKRLGKFVKGINIK